MMKVQSGERISRPHLFFGGESVERQAALFSDKDLKAMIVPLFLEQLLAMFVGLADTLIVSYAGEAAVSGVSLVNQFNTIFIYLFTALSSGGAVVVSQYIGRRAVDDAGEAASQLLSFSTVFSVLTALLILAGNEKMLRLMFGKVETDVMQACITYLRISAYSYPALAVYNSGAALFRSIGRTSVTMYLSVVSNVLNVIGNIIGVFLLKAGVAGVAYPSLIARIFSAAAITWLCFQEKNEVVYRGRWIFRWNGGLMKHILNIAVPNGLENGDTEAADEYLRKLTKTTLFISSVWNLLVFCLTPLFLKFYALEPKTKQLVIWLVLIHNLSNAVAFPFSGALSNGLRAAGDVKFTMYVSVISTIAVRLLFSCFLGITLKMGVIGIAIAMVLDWITRAVFLIWRLKTGRWKGFRVI